MTAIRVLAGVLGASLIALWAAAADACSLKTIGELNVDLSRGTPIVGGEINGVQVKIIIDTGSSTSIISGPAARAIGLIGATTPGGYVFAIGGKRDAYSTVLKSLKVGTLTATDLPPIMVGGPIPGAPDVAMLVGDDFLSQFDVELDLADHMIRLFRAEDCAPPQLVYWNKPYSQAALAPGRGIETVAALNGKRALAALDTGASRSLVDAAAAADAGEGSQPHPQLAVTGLGPSPRQAWNDDFATLAIGDESIAHARIEVADFARDFDVIDTDTRIGRHDGAPSMLIGEDFLHAHRVMVDFKNRVMVFTYTGGPIFSTTGTP